MENVLFKISFPGRVPRADRGGVRDAAAPGGADRLADIDRVVIETQEPGLRIIDKTGPLANPADRDHCLQYMTAVPLIFGRLTAADYEDAVAQIRAWMRCASKMIVRENVTFTEEYYDGRQALHRQRGAGVLQGRYGDRSVRSVDVPLGHPKRRAEGIPALVKKFESSVAAHFAPATGDQDQGDVRRPHAARGDASPRVRRC
jgi:2-methylcitrate dehydratase